MKQAVKKTGGLLLVCALMLSLFILPVSASTSSASLSDQIKQIVQSVFEQASASSIEDLESQYGKSDFLTEFYDKVQQTEDEAGKFVKTGSVDVDIDEASSTATATFVATYEKKAVDVTFTLNYTDGSSLANLFKGVTMDVRYTKGEMLGQAVGNSLLGIGIVLLILIVLAVVIYLFKYLGKLRPEDEGEEEKLPEGDMQTYTITPGADADTAGIAAEATGIAATKADTELSDEMKLVLGMAIAAYEEDMHRGGDAYVARKLRKKTTNQWKRA